MSSDELPSELRSRISAFHVIVIFLSLVMTIGAWLFSQSQIETRIETRFKLARDQAMGLIRERMRKYEDALWAGVAAIDSHDGDISAEDWHIFARSLKIDEKYPGINGIGVIHFLEPGDVAAYLTEQRRTRPDFRIHPAHDQPIFMPISYIEPVDINAAAVGLDVAHEINRRTAAEQSRQTGTARITGPIILVQDAGHTPGFLFYAPFRSNEATTSTGHRTEGAVYAPFVVRKLMEGLLAKELRDIRFAIRDGGEVIYDEHDRDDPLFDAEPLHSDVVTLDLYGREWILDIRTDLAFRQANIYAQPTLILIGGLVIEALIIALLVLLSRANARAVAYAKQVTAALRAESAALSETNQELEQFVYITSHDLKTPIRGIGGLTEMLKEDLEEYCKSPGANPDVAKNLGHIEERVERMNDLTRGVLEYSTANAEKGSDGVVVLADALDALALDLGLEDGRLRFDGSLDAVRFDTSNFRRVLENLVGNAVKHHRNPAALSITVTAQARGDFGHFSVRDNGSGIDQRFHERIFKVFQTLRDSHAPESTGIGLAIVKKLVEQHGGAVTLVSEPGAGAEFRFIWPLAQNAVSISCSGHQRGGISAGHDEHLAG